MRSKATFRLHGESGGTAAQVTRLLGVSPSGSVEAGERVRPRSPASEVSGWWLESAAEPEDGGELATHLHRVMDKLEPVADELGHLVELGYWANWFCYVESSGTEHAVELDRVTLTRLLRLPGDMWLDVYPDDE
jgi:hypothetical protein